MGGGSGGSGGEGGEGGGAGDAGTPPPFAISGKGVVRFKRNIRLTTDFAVAMELPLATVCQELGQYSCTLTVHPLAVGGTDPFSSGLYEPLPYTGATSPLVIDRIALSACSQRVELDLADPPNARIYRELAIDADGRLNPDQPGVGHAIETLYQRALLRPPTAGELAHLRALYRDIEATGKPAPAKSWAVVSCFAVMSSIESVFY
jgi:hypothetical protein